MIARDYITEWRAQAPWVQDFQVEQDLVISRAFSEYMERGRHGVTRAQFERNIEGKLHDRQFTADIGPLLADGFSWDIEAAAASVGSQLIARLPGDPWKGAKRAEDIAE